VLNVDHFQHYKCFPRLDCRSILCHPIIATLWWQTSNHVRRNKYRGWIYSSIMG